MLTAMYDDRPDVKARLEDDLVVWMTTVDNDGRPRSSLVWFAVSGDTIVMFSRDDTPRLRNIRANPHVSVAFNSDEDGTGPIIIEGDAEIIGTRPRFDEDAAYFGKYERHLARWDFTLDSYAAGYPERVHIRPARLRAR
jgi:PPOX class probable F420-dependent enzyme